MAHGDRHVQESPRGNQAKPWGRGGCIPASLLSSLVLPADPLPLPWVLQEVELRLLGEAACQCLYSRPGPFNLTFQLLPGMLCAGYPEGRRDTCQVRGGAYTCLQEQAEPQPIGSSMRNRLILPLSYF